MKHTVSQSHARILRECLAWCYRYAPPSIQQKIHQALSEYAKAIKKYCECPERCRTQKGDVWICLDCGQIRKNSKG